MHQRENRNRNLFLESLYTDWIFASAAETKLETLRTMMVTLITGSSDWDELFLRDPTEQVCPLHLRMETDLVSETSCFLAQKFSNFDWLYSFSPHDDLQIEPFWWIAKRWSSGEQGHICVLVQAARLFSGSGRTTNITARRRECIRLALKSEGARWVYCTMLLA
jgi:hypothetical protein